jgi:hypothetical protein
MCCENKKIKATKINYLPLPCFNPTGTTKVQAKKFINISGNNEKT